MAHDDSGVAWQGDKFKRFTMQRLTAGLARIGVLMVADIKRSMSGSSSAPGMGQGSRAGGRGSAYKIKPHFTGKFDGTKYIAATKADMFGKGKRTDFAGTKRNFYDYMARTSLRRRSKPGEPPAVQSGALRRSITYEVSGLTCRVGTNLKYAKAMEFGAPAHKIEARRKKALAFYGNPTAGATRSGKPRTNMDLIVVRSVQHPGNAPRPFLKPALYRNRGTIQAILRGLLA